MSLNSRNFSDRIKHNNLAAVVKEMAKSRTNMTYVELHSGRGSYKFNSADYEGSALRVLRILEDENIEYNAFLHEIEPKIRARLRRKVRAKFPKPAEITFRSDWRNYIYHIITMLNEDSLILLDPDNMKDYHNQVGLTNLLKFLLVTGASIFAYVPQNTRTKSAEKNKQGVSQIRDNIRWGKRKAVDLMHPSYSKGCHERLDHNIIIADESVLEAVIAEHRAMCRRFRSDPEYENKFADFRRTYTFRIG